MGIKDNDIDKKYSAIRKDLQYIKITYGEVDDYCGAFCNCDAFEKLLKTPNKETAFKILLSKLECYFTAGYDKNSYTQKLPIEEDKKLQKIKEKWGL